MLSKRGVVTQFLRIICVLIIMLMNNSLSASAQDDVLPDPNCQGAPMPRLIVESFGRVLPGDANNVREQADRTTALLGAIPGGGQFTVLEGPVCSNGLNWWRVQTDDITGWTVEGSGSDYWIEPLSQIDTPVPTPSTWSNPYRQPEYRVSNPLIVGAVARVQTIDGEALALYSKPNDAEPIAELPINTLVTLVEEASNGWWKVEGDDGISGWLREGVEGRVRVRPTLAPICPYTDDRVLFIALDSETGVNLYTVRQDGARLCNMSYGLQFSFEVYDWSPDGNWIAYSAVLEGLGSCAFGCSGELYVESTDGSVLRRLTFGEHSGHLQWSPDGNWIAVQVDGIEAHTRDIRLIAPDGSQQRTVYTAAGFGLMRWSPDGKYLAVNEDETMSSGRSKFLRIINIETGDSQLVYKSSWRIDSLNWSPDSQFVAVAMYNNEPRTVLAEINVTNGDYSEVLSGETRGATYSPDGTKIAFWRLSQGAARWVEVLDRSTGEIKRLAALSGYNGRGLSWTAEGDALLVGSSGVMRVDATSGALRSIFVGDYGSNWYPPMMQAKMD